MEKLIVSWWWADLGWAILSRSEDFSALRSLHHDSGIDIGNVFTLSKSLMMGGKYADGKKYFDDLELHKGGASVPKWFLVFWPLLTLQISSICGESVWFFMCLSHITTTPKTCSIADAVQYSTRWNMIVESLIGILHLLILCHYLGVLENGIYPQLYTQLWPYGHLM